MNNDLTLAESVEDQFAETAALKKSIMIEHVMFASTRQTTKLKRIPDKECSLIG